MPTKPPVEEEANCTEPKSDNDKDNRCLFWPDQSTFGNNQGHAYQGRYQAWSSRQFSPDQSTTVIKVVASPYDWLELPEVGTARAISVQLPTISVAISVAWNVLYVIILKYTWLIDWLNHLRADSNHRSCYLSCQPSQLLSQLPTISEHLPTMLDLDLDYWLWTRHCSQGWSRYIKVVVGGEQVYKVDLARSRMLVQGG